MSEEAKKDGPLKASMLVVLKANNVIVAEVDDPVLWNDVFTAVSAGRSRLAGLGAIADTSVHRLGVGTANAEGQARASVSDPAGADPVHRFAKELGVDVDVLVAAVDPATSDPFARLDIHHWERMKKDLPIRGPRSMPPIVIAASILCLWNRHANFGVVTQAAAQKVLDGIGSRDRNPGRSLGGCDWLQQRPGGVIALNPAKVSKAVGATAAFCSQDWSLWKP